MKPMPLWPPNTVSDEQIAESLAKGMEFGIVFWIVGVALTTLVVFISWKFYGWVWANMIIVADKLLDLPAAIRRRKVARADQPTPRQKSDDDYRVLKYPEPDRAPLPDDSRFAPKS